MIANAATLKAEPRRPRRGRFEIPAVVEQVVDLREAGHRPALPRSAPSRRAARRQVLDSNNKALSG